MNQSQLPIFYLTPDPLWALGSMETQYPDYHILCIDHTDVIEMLEADGVKIFCLEKVLGQKNVIDRNTRKLLLHPKTQEYILQNSADGVGLVFFKPQFDLSLVLKDTETGQKRQVRSLNADLKLSRKLEDKIELVEFCREHGIAHPYGDIGEMGKLDFGELQKQLGLPLVMQLAQGWSGNRTFLIQNERDWSGLLKKYAQQIVKIGKLVGGWTLTNNMVIQQDRVLQSFPFFQIGGDLTEGISHNWAGSVGNEWVAYEGFPSRMVEPERVVHDVRSLTDRVGAILQEQGYRGYLGLDFIVSERDLSVWLQEINPRFTASVPMFSQMEKMAFGHSLLEQHYAAFGVEGFDRVAADVFFRPLRGTRLIARQINRSPLVVKGNLRSGVWQLCPDQEPVWSRAQFRVQDLKQSELLLFSVAPGREVGYGQELLQIQLLDLDSVAAIGLMKNLLSKSSI